MDSSYWNERFALTRFRYMRVSRSTGNETERIQVLRGGSISRNQDTSIKETATCEVVGALDLGADMVRVYADIEWRDGTECSECLGTFIPAQPELAIHGRYTTGTINLSGRLHEVESDLEPLVVASGTVCVDYVTEWLEDAGFEVICSDSSTYALSSAQSYGLGLNSEVTTEIGMLNALLDLAGFSSLGTDPYGRVLLSKYVEPAERPVAWEFTEGPSAKFLQEMTRERDTSEVPNIVFTVYNGDDETYVGYAEDKDSEFSYASRGYNHRDGYEYSDLPEGDDEDEMQETADAKAASLLATAQSVIHRLTFTHMYCPIALGDCVTVDFPSADVSMSGAVRTQTITLSAGCPVQAEIRAYERS